ncbi:MAG: site-specific integrase [Burkholderiales bacterium]
MFEQSINSPDEPMSRRLLDRLRDAIRRRHYSRRTEEGYIHWAKRFIYFHGKRHSSELGKAETTAFLRRDRGSFMQVLQLLVGRGTNDDVHSCLPPRPPCPPR